MNCIWPDYPQTVGKPSRPKGASKSVIARNHKEGANLHGSDDDGTTFSVFCTVGFKISGETDSGLVFFKDSDMMNSM